MTPDTDALGVHFEREIREQPEVLARLLEDEALQHTGAVLERALRERPVSLILTLARGSSDNAVTFFSYLAAQVLGLPVASVPPSLLSVYRTELHARNALAVGVSQSGESPDVVAGVRALRAAGALTLGLSNTPGSALLEAADYGILQQAGPERAVAASKTFSSQMLALALLVAYAGEDTVLLAALREVPGRMEAMLADTEPIAHLALRLTHAKSAYVLGRGLSYGPALETALKLKETCYLHAEAYSAAEFQHGPIAAVSASDPVLMLALADATAASNVEAARKLQEVGADLSIISSDLALRALASAAAALPAAHPVTGAFMQVAAGQLLALYLARAKGLEPDAPRHLSKVTRTM